MGCLTNCDRDRDRDRGCGCGCECGCDRDRDRDGGLFGGCNWIWILGILFFLCRSEENPISDIFEDCNLSMIIIAGLAYVVLCGCPTNRG